jgi:hypothetical protein
MHENRVECLKTLALRREKADVPEATVLNWNTRKLEKSVRRAV